MDLQIYHSATEMFQIEPQSDDKENEQVSQRASATLAGNKISDDWTSRNDRLRQRLVEEQDYLRVRWIAGKNKYEDLVSHHFLLL